MASIYRELKGPDGYRPGETKGDFLNRFEVGSGQPADPAQFPYYLLLVGGPSTSATPRSPLNLAVFRWAKENKAPACERLPRRPHSAERTPDAIATVSSFQSGGTSPHYRPIRILSGRDEVADQARRMAQRIAQLEKDPELARVFKEMEPLRKDVERLIEKAARERNKFAVRLVPPSAFWRAGLLLDYWFELKGLKAQADAELRKPHKAESKD